MFDISVHLNLIGGDDPSDPFFDKGIVFFAQHAVLFQHHTCLFHIESGFAGFFCAGVDDLFHTA
jgi:hypothetical protein